MSTDTPKVLNPPPGLHRRLESVGLAGFAAENTPDAQKGRVCVKEWVSSDDDRFHRYVHQLAALFFADVDAQRLDRFLVVLHADGTADVHLNWFGYDISVLAKGDIAAGERVAIKKVADIGRLWPVGIEVAPTDGIVFCFRHGWRFGLFYDLRAPDCALLDLDATERWFGWGFKQLAFREELATVADSPLYARMRADGWFPFLELLGGEYAELGRLYGDAEPPTMPALDAWVAKAFPVERVRSITRRWWGKPAFDRKRTLLEAGIEQFLRANPTDTIGAIKTLYSEIEGLLRVEHQAGNGDNAAHLIGKVKAQARARFDTEDALGFPKRFSSYLANVVFRGFETDGPADLTRNSALHGVAPAETYTRARALQLLLVLDQLSSFMGPAASPVPRPASSSGEGAE